jgi:hypothetical protein
MQRKDRPLEGLADNVCIKTSHRTFKLSKYVPCSKSRGMSPLSRSALATLAGTDAAFRTQSSQATVRLLGGKAACEKTVWCSLSIGYSLERRASSRIECSESGTDRVLEYASKLISPAAGEVNENGSGQKYCSNSGVAFSSARIEPQVGMTCSNRAC